MKFKIKPILVSLALLSFAATPVHADPAGDAKLDQMIKNINQQTQQLLAEVSRLKKQVKQLKAEKQTKQTVVKKEVFEEKTITKSRIDEVQTMAIAHLLGTTVTTAPFAEIPQAFRVTDLPVYNDGVNQDLWLLKQRQHPNTAYSLVSKVIPEHPTIQLSGRIEAQAIAAKPYTGNRTSDVDLTGAELNIVPTFNDWVSGFMSLVYDNSATNPIRVSNSRIQLQRAFIIVGDLNKSPFYASAGQMYVPFGQYFSNMISAPLTQNLGRVLDRALVLGYNQNGLYSSLYTFRGDSSGSSTSNKLNELGANLGYNYQGECWNSDVGVSYIANIADSQGMQSNGATSPAFTGFGGSFASEHLDHRVPGISIHGNLSTGPYRFIAEYIGATTDFNSQDLAFNGHGAQPKALNVEGAYQFKMMNLPSTFAIGYGRTQQALALNLPEQRYIATLSTSIWKDTIMSLEYRHEKNYSSGTTAMGSGLNNASSVNGWLGENRNQLTLQFGVYF